MPRTKIILCFYTFLLAQCFAFAEPQWSEFCPSKYESGEYINLGSVDFKSLHKMPYCKSEKKWVKVVNLVTVLPALDCWGATTIRKSIAKKNAKLFNQEQAYWNSRKVHFDKALQDCKAGKQKEICYQHVRQIEFNKNQAREQALYNQMLVRQQMYQNLQMQNLNSNIRNINNTMRYGY